jgi:hypothetical protein
MLPMNELRRIYDEYLSDATRIASMYKPTDGLLGVGRGPGSDPCHDRFTERLERAVESIAASAPPSPVVAEALRFIYETPLKYQGNSLVYWMLLAVHSLTEKLVVLLLPEDAAGLCARYNEVYPKSERLPAQKKILALLKAQAGDIIPRKKNTLIDFFRGRGR